MDWIVINGVSPYDGRYPFEVADQDGELNITTREWGWIKRLANVQPLTFEEAVRSLDAELMTVLAAIAMRRAGKIEQRDVEQVFDRLVDAPFGSRILYETDTVEDDAGPPHQGSPPSSSSRPGSSGGESTNSLVISPAPPNGSGIPDSDFSGLPQPTLGS